MDEHEHRCVECGKTLTCEDDCGCGFEIVCGSCVTAKLPPLGTLTRSVA
jgi:hypothetical protein